MHDETSGFNVLHLLFVCSKKAVKCCNAVDLQHRRRELLRWRHSCIGAFASHACAVAVLWQSFHMWRGFVCTACHGTSFAKLEVPPLDAGGITDHVILDTSEKEPWGHLTRLSCRPMCHQHSPCRRSSRTRIRSSVCLLADLQPHHTDGSLDRMSSADQPCAAGVPAPSVLCLPTAIA